MASFLFKENIDNFFKNKLTENKKNKKKKRKAISVHATAVKHRKIHRISFLVQIRNIYEDDDFPLGRN
jgi:hypothetical protein